MKAKPYRAVVSMCFNVETADKARAEKDIEHVLDRSLKLSWFCPNCGAEFGGAE